MSEPQSPPAGSVGVRKFRSPISADTSLVDLVREVVRRLEQSGEDLSGRESRFLGLLEALVQPRGLNEANRFSVEKSAGLLRTMQRHPDFDITKLEGARVADLGCGSLNPLGAGVILMALGAGECVALDPEAVRSESAAARTLYNCAVAMLTVPQVVDAALDRETTERRLASLDLERLYRGDPGGIDGAPLRFVQGFLEDAGFETGQFDVVHSNALLEHVLDPDAFIAELARISKPGAIGCHLVDGSDHRRYEDPETHPLEMLCADHPGPIVHHVNRVRPRDLIEEFEAHGFEVRRFAPHFAVKVDDALRARMVEPYRSMSDETLSCVSATLHVTKL